MPFVTTSTPRTGLLANGLCPTIVQRVLLSGTATRERSLSTSPGSAWVRAPYLEQQHSAPGIMFHNTRPASWSRNFFQGGMPCAYACALLSVAEIARTARHALNTVAAVAPDPGYISINTAHEVGGGRATSTSRRALRLGPTAETHPPSGTLVLHSLDTLPISTDIRMRYDSFV